MKLHGWQWNLLIDFSFFQFFINANSAGWKSWSFNVYAVNVVIMIVTLTPLKSHNTIELEELKRVLTDFQLMCYFTCSNSIQKGIICYCNHGNCRGETYVLRLKLNPAGSVFSGGIDIILWNIKHKKYSLYLCCQP